MIRFLLFYNGIYTNKFSIKTFQFFPEANEVKFARNLAFGGASFKLDYLTKPSLFEDFGFVSKVKMADRVKQGDELYLVAYPYFNVNGKLRVHVFLFTVLLYVMTCLIATSFAIQRCLWWKSFIMKLLQIRSGN